MPHPEIDRLEKESTPEATNAAISACIAAEVRAGVEQSQAVAMCMSMAREKGANVPKPQGGA